MIKRIFSILTVAVAGFAAMALDLPVKEINGKPYYYYTIKKGDTVYSLVSRLGITRKQLIDSNPSASGILKAGDVLYFSVDEFGDGKPYVIDREPEVEPMPEGRVRHQVKKGETLYGISRQYGVNQEQIVALNPRVRSGLKTGMIIEVPVKTEAESEPEIDLSKLDHSNNNSLTPVTPAIVEVGSEALPDEDNLTNDDALTDEVTEDATDTDSIAEIPVRRTASIAVVLPFMLESESPSKQAMLYTDFYKGLLLAADTLSNRGDSLKIYAFDTMGDINRLRSLLNDDAVKNASVIIAPDDERQLAAIADAVAGNETKVINVFNVKDSLYVSHNELVQTNIPHMLMYGKAFEAIDRLYGDYIPVILRNEGGRSDKAEFISFIKDAYGKRGITPLEIVYKGALLNAELESLPGDGVKYLIIPSSGSLVEFNKFVHAVKTVRESSGDNRKIELFGYPDWTAFRGDAEAMLHAVGATVFSRFYYDPDSFDTRSLNQAFVHWYGDDMMAVVPNHGVLGFDVGNMVIRNLRANDGVFDPTDGRYVGVQSSFEFVKPSGDAGYCNDEVYILRFGQGTQVERLSF